MLRPAPGLLSATLAGFVMLGCVTPPSKGDKKPDLSNTTVWALSSPDVTVGESMPPQFTCEGSGENPELDWNDGPDGTQSYAIVLKDISITEKMPADPATLSSAYTWAIWNLSAPVRQIPHGLSAAANPPELDGGAQQWSSDGRFRYLPPCPNAEPNIEPSKRVSDHFSFTLYALPTPVVLGALDPAQNEAQELDNYVKTVALHDVNLLFTSDAALETGGGGAGGNGAGGAAAE
jgi:phosphatidylethanolamine-binding protein (PEBP) family uncharacterized protein